MIEDLDENIKQLLVAEMPIQNGMINVQFDQPKREWSAKLGKKPTINFFLYDVRENNTLRQHQWERLQSDNGKKQPAQLKRTPFRMDCYYMLTVWGADPEVEHSVLSRCILTLLRFPVLPEDRLIGKLQNPLFPIQTRLASYDKLTNPAEVWASLDNEMRPSLSYIITLTFDPWQKSIVEAPIVNTLTFRAGQTSTLPLRWQLNPDVPPTEMHFIGGAVRDHQGHSKAGVEVALKGTGWFSTTDDDGRFILGSVPTGEYDLVVWLPEGKPVQRRILVPTEGDSYDMEV